MKRQSRGHWLVTTRAVLSEPKSLSFTDDDKLLVFLRRHPHSLVSWIKEKKK